MKGNPTPRPYLIPNSTSDSEKSNPIPGEGKFLDEEKLSKKDFQRIILQSINNKEGDSFDVLELSNSEFERIFTAEMLEGVRNLPEEVSEKLGITGVEEINNSADMIIEKIKKEKNIDVKSQLQTELLFHFIALTSRAQDGGMHGMLPSISREISGLDCSISTWCLKQKIIESGIDDIDFSFGNPSDHVVGIVTLANNTILYVESQNGFIAEIQVEKVEDNDQLETYSPIFEIKSHETLNGNVPGLEDKTYFRDGAEGYIPKFLGISKRGLPITITNFGMLVSQDNGDVRTATTRTANQFRDAIDNDEDKRNKFKEEIPKAIGGKVIQQSPYESLSQKHFNEFKAEIEAKENQIKIEELKKKL